MFNTITWCSGLAHCFSEDAVHLRALTGLRAWAAFWVLLYHAWSFAVPRQIELQLGSVILDFTPLISLGGAGVSIFFVLSGFLLALPYAEWQAGRRERPTPGRYFLRRVARVFPAYYAQLAILVMLAAWIPERETLHDLPSVVRHLLMLFTPPPIGMTPINLVWWTLPIEFSFYLALPVLSFLLTPARWWWLLGGSLVVMWSWRYGVAITMADVPVPQRVYAAYQLPGALDMFGIGMFAALIHVHRDRLPAWLFPHSRQSLLALLGLCLVVASVYWLFPQRGRYWADNPIFYLWTPALSFGIAAVILAAAAHSRLTEWLFGNRVMMFGGVISYSVYLWHFPVLSWVNGMDFIQGINGYRLPWLLLLVIPITVFIASLSFALVERPFMRLRRR